MKIGILTFHAPHNFGSMLQNYALQHTLISMGHEVQTINLRNYRQKYMYNHPLLFSKDCHTYRGMLSRLKNPLWLFTECRKWNLFEQFLNKYIILTEEFKDWEGIRKKLHYLNYDAIISGSDQIWNTFCYDFDWSYFLPGNIKPIIKIAYCPSFGNEIPRMQKDKDLESRLLRYLKDFDYLSVREDNASKYLYNLLGINIPVVSDPTILVNPTIYNQFVGKPLVQEPYIYYYTPSHIPDINAEEMAIQIAKLLNIKIITSYSNSTKKSSMKRISTGPSEFLNLVKNAQLVIGKSYHLVIFSILFHKDFVTIKSGKDARISSLLTRLNISYRNIDSIDDYCLLKPIDFRFVDKELEVFRKDSLSYLRKAINQNNEK